MLARVLECVCDTRWLELGMSVIGALRGATIRSRGRGFHVEACNEIIVVGFGAVHLHGWEDLKESSVAG